MLHGNTIPFPQKTPLITRLPGLPEAITLDPTTLDVTALAVANLAGESWAEMTPTRQEEFRQWAMFAAVAAHPEGLRLLAYAVGLVSDLGFGIDQTADGATCRRLIADRTMSALRGAALRVVGVCHPDRHAALVEAMRFDAELPIPRRP